MAEIPVERKGGIPWWVWLIGALLLIGLLFLLFGNNRNEPDRVAVAPTPVVATETVPVVAPIAAPVDNAAISGPITDLATIIDTTDRSALVGRQVDLDNVRVLDVVGDRGFFVGADQSRRAFVVLNEVPTPNTPVEGRYDVTRGQMININGVMRRPSDTAIADQPIQDMPAGTEVLIHAQSLDIVQRP